MNKTLLIVIAVLILAILVILFLIRNRMDRKELEEQIENDYHKPKTHDTDSGENGSI